MADIFCCGAGARPTSRQSSQPPQHVSDAVPPHSAAAAAGPGITPSSPYTPATPSGYYGRTASIASLGSGTQRVPDDVLQLVWSYLLHSTADLHSAELVCRRWREVMRSFWPSACTLCGVADEECRRVGYKFAFFSHVHHFHWKHALWGDFPNSYVTRSDTEDYLLYDTYPDVALLYSHALLLFSVPKWDDIATRRELWLQTMLPESLLREIIDPDAQHPPPGETFCGRRSRFRVSASTVKTDLCGPLAAVMTTDTIDVFHDSSQPHPVASEYEAFPTEGDTATFTQKTGSLDCTDIACTEVAVLHVSDGRVWALLKRPQGIQTWDAYTHKKLYFYPIPGVYRWPEDDPYYTWKSQEKFCFKDPSSFGVVIDDDCSVWVLDTRPEHRREVLWAHVCCNEPSQACPFGDLVTHPPPCHPQARTQPRATLQPTPVAPLTDGGCGVGADGERGGSGYPAAAGGGGWSGRPVSAVEDPSLPRALDSGQSGGLRPANVRVCGSCLLVWGGRGVLDDFEELMRTGAQPGRAFVQLWRPESSVNLNSTRSDLVCALNAKYDHILMCHCDAHRVYVLFHPFHMWEPTAPPAPEHTQHVMVDVWDAWGGGFVCRRIGHDEDRVPRQFFLYEDLTPAFIQILHAGPESLVYYCSQYKGEANYLSVRQLSTLATARERDTMCSRLAATSRAPCNESSGPWSGSAARMAAAASAEVPDVLCPWWYQLAPGEAATTTRPPHDRPAQYRVGLRMTQQHDGDSDSDTSSQGGDTSRVRAEWWVHRGGAPPMYHWTPLEERGGSESESDVPVLEIGVLHRDPGAAGHSPHPGRARRMRRLPGGWGWTEKATRLRRMIKGPYQEEERRAVRADVTLELIAHLMGHCHSLRSPALLAPPLRPDFAELRNQDEVALGTQLQPFAPPHDERFRWGLDRRDRPGARQVAVAAPPAAYGVPGVVSTQLSQYAAERANDLRQSSSAVWQLLQQTESVAQIIRPTGEEVEDELPVEVRECLLGLLSGILDQRLEDLFVHVPVTADARGRDAMAHECERGQLQQGKG
eukprot:Hpha_TRINITY_DN13809_c0_g1::TRINITY_DN13809_c0_g1_i1::g.69815::m.69815